MPKKNCKIKPIKIYSATATIVYLNNKEIKISEDFSDLPEEEYKLLLETIRKFRRKNKGV